MNDIILTGPKHCGKTSTGKALASLLANCNLCSCDFIDLDELILQTTGKTPRELYNESPKVFQNAELNAMTTLFNSNTNQRQRVIATGGGIIDNSEALDLLKKSGATIVYLNISAETAWQRITQKGDLPPFLKTETPQETHRILHERRSEAYIKLANITIKVEGKTPVEIAKEIYMHFCNAFT